MMLSNSSNRYVCLLSVCIYCVVLLASGVAAIDPPPVLPPPLPETAAVEEGAGYYASCECKLPEGTDEYSLITEQHAIVAAHNVFKGIAVGGFLVDPHPQTSKVIASNDAELPSYVVWNILRGENMIFHGGVDIGKTSGKFDTIEDVIDYDQFKCLAKNAIDYESDDGEGYKVIVLDHGGTFNTADFRGPDGQGEDNGKTLVIFNTYEPVILTSTDHGRQFGPTIIAPYSFVILLSDAGYIDGTVVAKSFVTIDPYFDGHVSYDKATSLQMHGETYTGPIKCL